MDRARYIIVNSKKVDFQNWNDSLPPQDTPTKVFTVEYPDRYRIFHQFGVGWLRKLTPSQVSQRLLKDYLACVMVSFRSLKLLQAWMFLVLAIHQYKKK